MSNSISISNKSRAGGNASVYIKRLSPDRIETLAAAVRRAYLAGGPDGPRSMTATAWGSARLRPTICQGGYLTPAEFFDQLAGSPPAARRLIQRLREADDRIVNNEKRSGRAHGNWRDVDNQTAGSSVNNLYLAAKNPWLQQQFHTLLGVGDLPFVVGRRPVAGEELPPWQPHLALDDAVPFWLSRNHFVIEKRDGGYRVRDLCSTLGTIVNYAPIGHYPCADAPAAWGLTRLSSAPLHVGANEVIAGGADSPFVFTVVITSASG
jgi:hypothetical protein